MTEADRADAAFAAVFPDPCACPARHASTPEGTCDQPAMTARLIGEASVPMCTLCADCQPA